MTTVTRTLYGTSSCVPALCAVCRATAFVRADLWRRYGALGNVGKRAADIRKEVTAGGWYASLAVDGTIRAETTKDAVNDILTYKAAACAGAQGAREAAGAHDCLPARPYQRGQGGGGRFGRSDVAHQGEGSVAELHPPHERMGQ